MGESGVKERSVIKNVTSQSRFFSVFISPTILPSHVSDGILISQCVVLEAVMACLILNERLLLLMLLIITVVIPSARLHAILNFFTIVQ